MDERTKLDELRGLLTQLDQEILRAIERRARVAHDFAKERTGTAKLAPISDGAHLLALEKAVQPPLSAASIRPIWNAIDNACRIYETAPRVGFVGAEGGVGWSAARSYFGAGIELVRSDSLSAALDDVVRSRAEFAVVPYESLKDGPIFPTIQAIAGADLRLVGEREVAHTLALVSPTGEPDEFEKIYVTPQDHVACVHYIESNHPRALVLDVRSPIMAWELAGEGKKCAAIVPSGTVAPHDMRVVRENIGDDGEVRMRYGIVSRLPAPRSGHDATAMLISVADRAGALHDILQHFKERSCSLRRIQSRPVPGPGWEYIFYIEVTGHVTDRPLVSALEGVKKEAKLLKIIGSFPLERPEPASPESAPRRA